MVYSIEFNGVESIVFGKAFRVPSGQYPPVIKDIMGNTVSMYEAMNESNNNINRDSLINCTYDKIKRNMELGLDIIALWREYVITKSTELGINGINGIEQLKELSLITVSLMSGMLSESAILIDSIVEDSIITSDIKAKFSSACNSANHLV